MNRVNKINIAFKEISNENEFDMSAVVVQRAFKTVADEFSLTKENARTNAAFIVSEDIKTLATKGVKLFGVFQGELLVGFIAIEKADEKTYYMEKLAVIPEYRHKGIGRRIMDFVFEYVKKCGGEKVSIGIINENTVLKRWYLDYGFIELSIRKFDSLPFEVCFMEKRVL